MIILVLILGLLLRLTALPGRSFWFDESITYHFAKLNIPDLFKAVATDNNPPLYYLIMHFTEIFSTNQIFMRIPSLLANLLTIFLIYKLFKNKLKGNISLIAAALYSVSPLSIYIATEARLQSLAALLLVILTSSCLSLIKRPFLKEMVLFISISIITLYTSYYAPLLYIPMTLIIVYKKQALSTKKWLLIVLASFIFLVPWLIFLLQTSHNGCWCPNTLLALPSVFASPAVSGVGIVTMRSFLNLPIVILLLFAATALTTFIFFLKGIVSAGKISLVYFIPLITLSIVGLFSTFFSPKGFSIFSPIFFLITASGINKTNSPQKNFIILTILLVLISTFQNTNSFFSGEPLEKIAQITMSKPDIPIIHTSLATYYPIDFYNGRNQQQLLITKNPLQAQTLNFIGGKQEKISKNLQKIWFIDYPKWTEEESYKNAESDIFLNYNVKQSLHLNNINIYYMEK